MICILERISCYQTLVLSKVMLKENFLIHFVWRCTAPNFGTTPPMLLRHFIPRGGNVSGALMDYLVKLKIILPVLWDVKPIHVQLHKRFVNFVKKNAKTENEIIKICHNLTMQGSRSAVSNSDSHISFLYNISRHNVPTSKHSLQFDTPADDVVAVSACINQLLTLKKHTTRGYYLLLAL